MTRAAKQPNQSPKESPEPGSLVPSPTGRGQIRYGSKPGNTPGTGRPPSEVRKAARLAFDERLPTLSEIADNTESKDSDRIRAIEALGHFGFGKELSAAVIREKLQRTVEVIRENLGDDADALIAQIKAIWI